MATGDLRQRISLDGADDVIKQLSQLGEAGANALKQWQKANDAASSIDTLGEAIKQVNAVTESFVSTVSGIAGKVVGVFGGIAVGITGAVGALVALSKSSSENIATQADLAQAAGTTVENFGALKSALAQLGANTDDLDTIFKRLAIRIATDWPVIQKSIRDASTKAAADILAVKEAALTLSETQIKLSGNGADPALQAAIGSQRELLTLQKQQLALTQAQAQASDNQATSITSAIKVAESFVTGVSTTLNASKLSAEQLVQGLIAVAGGANGTSIAVKKFGDALGAATSAAPDELQVLFTISAAFQNMKDESQKLAIANVLLGRGFSASLIAALSEGPAAIRKNIDEMKAFVKTLGDADEQVKIAKDFNKEFSITTDVLTKIKNAVGSAFAPSLTEGLKIFSDSLKANGASIVQFAKDLAERVKPVILDFFRILAGQEVQTPWVQTVVGAAKSVVDFFRNLLGPAVADVFRLLNGEEVKTPWVAALIAGFARVKSALIDIAGQFKAAFALIGDALNFVTDKINDAFGIKLTAAETAVTAFALLFVSRFGVIGAAIAAAIVLIEKLAEAQQSEAEKSTRSLLNQQSNAVDQLEAAGGLSPEQIKKFRDDIEAARAALKIGAADNDILGLKELDAQAETDLQTLVDLADSAGIRLKTSLKGNIATDADKNFKDLQAQATASLDGIERKAKETSAAISAVNTAAKPAFKVVDANDPTSSGVKVAPPASDFFKKPDTAAGPAQTAALVNPFTEADTKIRAILTALKTFIDEQATAIAASIQKALAALSGGAPQGAAAADDASSGKGAAGGASPFSGLADQLLKPFKDAADQIPALLDAILQKVTEFQTALSDGLTTAFNGLFTSFQTVASQIQSLLDQLISKAQQAAQALQQVQSGGNLGGQTGSPFASGGHVLGAGNETSDSIPAWLSHNEFVVRAQQVRNVGVDFLHFVNRSGVTLADVYQRFFVERKFALGGPVDAHGVKPVEFSGVLKNLALGAFNLPKFSLAGIFNSPDVPKFALGGLVDWVNRFALPQFGVGGIVDWMNRAKAPGFAAGGLVDWANRVQVPGFASGGLVDWMNRVQIPAFNAGGLVDWANRIQVPGFASGGLVDWANRFALPHFSAGGLAEWVNRVELPSFNAGGLVDWINRVALPKFNVGGVADWVNQYELPRFSAGGLVDWINRLAAPEFASGGLVDWANRVDVPRFAAGGLVDWVNRFELPKFSVGGFVDGLSESLQALAVPVPGYASGGLVLAAAGGGARVLVDLRTNHGSFAAEMAPDQFKGLERAATLNKVRSAGRRQSSVD